MTIRPTSSGYVMTCDEPGCVYTRPVRDAADVACAQRCGWERDAVTMTDEPTRHRCPKCAAAKRRTAA